MASKETKKHYKKRLAKGIQILLKKKWSGNMVAKDKKIRFEQEKQRVLRIGKIILKCGKTLRNYFPTQRLVDVLLYFWLAAEKENFSIPREYTLVFISNIFICNARLELATNQGNSKAGAELSLFENCS